MMRGVLGAVLWYLRELTGESAYDHYVERHQRLHPDEPLLSRRDFERRRTDHRDSTPNTHCC